MSDESEVARSERAAWLRQEPAKELRETIEGELMWATQKFDAVAERSTDPEVRGAYERVRALREMLGRLHSE